MWEGYGRANLPPPTRSAEGLVNPGVRDGGLAEESFVSESRSLVDSRSLKAAQPTGCDVRDAARYPRSGDRRLPGAVLPS